MIKNISSHLPNNESKNCLILHLIGVYMSILLVSSTIFNSLSIWIFYKAKLFTPINVFMVSLLVLNLCATYVEAPYMIYNSYHCKYNCFSEIISKGRILFKNFALRVIENKIDCIINGFTMYFVGNFETYLLVAISIER